MRHIFIITETLIFCKHPFKNIWEMLRTTVTRYVFYDIIEQMMQIERGKIYVKEQLERVMVPVLLGDGAQAIRVARKLYRSYGVISHLYCSRPSIFLYLLSFVRVVRIPDYMQGELLIEDLRTFAQQYPDLLFCLIPCTEAYCVFCTACKEKLEPYYIFVDPAQLQGGTLPYLSKEELPT